MVSQYYTSQDINKEALKSIFNYCEHKATDLIEKYTNLKFQCFWIGYMNSIHIFYVST